MPGRSLKEGATDYSGIAAAQEGAKHAGRQVQLLMIERLGSRKWIWPRRLPCVMHADLLPLVKIHIWNRGASCASMARTPGRSLVHMPMASSSASPASAWHLSSSICGA